MAIRPLPGYPAVNEKGGYDWIGDVDGPASYVNSGVFGTSGQQLNASDFGFGGFENIGTDTLSSDAVNEVVVVIGATVAGATNLQPAPTGAGAPAPAVSSVVLHWYTGLRGVGANPTEVANGVNLSAKSIRLRVTAV